MNKYVLNFIKSKHIFFDDYVKDVDKKLFDKINKKLKNGSN